MKVLKVIVGIAFTLGLLLVFGAVGGMDAGNISDGACMIRSGIGMVLMIAAAVVGGKIEESEE